MTRRAVIMLVVGLVLVIGVAFIQPRVLPTCGQVAEHIVDVGYEDRRYVGLLENACHGRDWQWDDRIAIMSASTPWQIERALAPYINRSAQ